MRPFLIMLSVGAAAMAIALCLRGWYSQAILAMLFAVLLDQWAGNFESEDDDDAS